MLEMDGEVEPQQEDPGRRTRERQGGQKTRSGAKERKMRRDEENLAGAVDYSEGVISRSVDTPRRVPARRMVKSSGAM